MLCVFVCVLMPFIFPVPLWFHPDRPICRLMLSACLSCTTTDISRETSLWVLPGLLSMSVSLSPVKRQPKSVLIQPKVWNQNNRDEPTSLTPTVWLDIELRWSKSSGQKSHRNCFLHSTLCGFRLLSYPPHSLALLITFALSCYPASCSVWDKVLTWDLSCQKFKVFRNDVWELWCFLFHQAQKHVTHRHHSDTACIQSAAAPPCPCL